MNVTVDKLKSIFSKKGYTWYTDRPNLIGIRTTLQVPDIFNDLFVCVWTQPTMPTGLSAIDQQKWLNSWLFLGKNQKPLAEDGDFGTNSQTALAEYQKVVGKERIKYWTITTDPGTYWLNNPMNKLGTAVFAPGQYINAYQLGSHAGKADHPALIQTGAKVKVFRDADKDSIAEETSTIDEGFHGCNIHRSNATGVSQKIGKWSAGCQVFQVKTDHDQLLQICKNYKDKTGNKFTYTLLKENDLA